MTACPICKRTAAPRGDNAAFPFCSARCKQVDLGQWLDEGYRVPGEPASLDDALDEGNGGVGQTKREDT
jgi:endogenous inhibitor of DNA gyrase (YacG/DUF329 family)